MGFESKYRRRVESRIDRSQYIDRDSTIRDASVVYETRMTQEQAHIIRQLGFQRWKTQRKSLPSRTSSKNN